MRTVASVPCCTVQTLVLAMQRMSARHALQTCAVQTLSGHQAAKLAQLHCMDNGSGTSFATPNQPQLREDMRAWVRGLQFAHW